MLKDYQAAAQNEEAPGCLLEGHSARRLAVARTVAFVRGFPDDRIPMYLSYFLREHNLRYLSISHCFEIALSSAYVGISNIFLTWLMELSGHRL